MRAKLILAAALLVVPLAIAGYAIADSGGRNDAAKAESATARYHDLQNALDDGYSELPAVQDTSTVKATNGCASSKLGAGAMGIHFLKGPLDEVVEAQHARGARLRAPSERADEARGPRVRLHGSDVAVRAGVQQDRPRALCRWQRGRELRLDAARLDLDAEPDRGADALEPAGDLRQRLIRRQAERSGARMPLEDRVAPGERRPGATRSSPHETDRPGVRMSFPRAAGLAQRVHAERR